MNHPIEDPKTPGKPAAEQRTDLHTSEHLSNERTFLAWIRTSISLLGLGFVVAKFSVWLRELSRSLHPSAPIPHSGLSMPLGITLMTLSAVLALTAGWRYRVIKKAIINGESTAADGTTIAVSVIVTAIAVALIIYMLATG